MKEDEINRIIQEKKKADKKQRMISLAVILFSLLLIITIYYSVTQKQRILETTKATLVTNDSIAKKTIDSLVKIKILDESLIECIAQSTHKVDRDGDTLYDFILRIKESSLESKLKSVDYFFNDPGFTPQHKISYDSLNNFQFSYRASGTVDTLQVYLSYKNIPKPDTILYPLSDNLYSGKVVVKVK